MPRKSFVPTTAPAIDRRTTRPRLAASQPSRAGKRKVTATIDENIKLQLRMLALMLGTTSEALLLEGLNMVLDKHAADWPAVRQARDGAKG